MIKKYSLRLIGPAIFISILYWYIDIDKFKTLIMQMKWPYLLLGLAMVPLLILIRSLRWRSILAKLGINYSLWETFQVYFVEMVAIVVVSAIGTFVKVLYLKNEGYGLLKPALSVVADKYYDYLLPLFFGLTSAGLVALDIDPDLGVVILFCIIFTMFIPARKMIWIFEGRILPGKIRRLFAQKGYNPGMHIGQIYDTLDFTNYVLSVSGFVLYFMMIYCLNISIGVDLTFAQVVLIMTITSLVTMIPVSFFGIGTRDVGLIAIFKWFGCMPEQAVVLSMTLLLLRVAIVLIGSIFWFMKPPPLTRTGAVEDASGIS